MTPRGGPSARRAAVVAVGLAVLAAFALRAAVGLAVNVESDVQRGFDFYGFMADHVLDGRGLVWRFYGDSGPKWANRAPLYPLLVAAARAAFGRAHAAPVVVAQAALGALGCLVPAALAARWGGTKAAVAAAWTAALWPYWIVLDTGLVEHVVYAPLAGLAVLLALRAADADGPDRSFFAGASAGLAVLARLTFAATAACLCVVAAARGPRLARAALFAAGAAAALLPWIVRNHDATGAWTLGTDGGRALWVGNSAATYALCPAKSIDELERAMLKDLTPADWSGLRAKNGDEVGQDAMFRDRAFAEIASRPAEAAWGAVRKAAALWSPVMNPQPVPPAKLVVFGLSSLALFGGTLAAAASVPRIRADIPACAAAAASFTLVAAVFWGQSRYLAPLHGIGIAAAAAWVSSKRGAPGAGGVTTPRIFALFLLLVGLTLAPGHVDNVDSRVVLRTAERLLNDGTCGIPYEERTCGKPHEYGEIGPDGLFQMKFGIGNAVLDVPFVVLGHVALSGIPRRDEVGASLASALWFAAAGVLVFRLARRHVGDRGGALVAVAYSLATYAVVYGRSSYLETPLTVAVLAAYDAAVVLRGRPDSRKSAAILGFACAATLWIKLAGALVLLGVAPILWTGGVRRQSRGLLVAAGVAAVGVAGLLWTNAARFGSPFATGYAGSARFDHPLAAGAAGLVAGLRGGLFTYSPLLVLAVPGTAYLARKDGALAVGIWTAFAASLALYAKFFSPFGGDAWGPRYLLPNAALLAVPAGIALHHWFRADSVRRASAGAALAFSAALQAPPAVVSFTEVYALRASVGDLTIAKVGPQRLLAGIVVEKACAGDGRFDLWPVRAAAEKPARAAAAWTAWCVLGAAAVVAGASLVRRAGKDAS